MVGRTGRNRYRLHSLDGSHIARPVHPMNGVTEDGTVITNSGQQVGTWGLWLIIGAIGLSWWGHNVPDDHWAANFRI